MATVLIKVPQEELGKAYTWMWRDYIDKMYRNGLIYERTKISSKVLFVGDNLLLRNTEYRFRIKDILKEGGCITHFLLESDILSLEAIKRIVELARDYKTVQDEI